MPQKASKISNISGEAWTQTSLGELQAAGAFGPNLFWVGLYAPHFIILSYSYPSGVGLKVLIGHHMHDGPSLSCVKHVA